MRGVRAPLCQPGTCGEATSGRNECGWPLTTTRTIRSMTGAPESLCTGIASCGGGTDPDEVEIGGCVPGCVRRGGAVAAGWLAGAGVQHHGRHQRARLPAQEQQQRARLGARGGAWPGGSSQWQPHPMLPCLSSPLSCTRLLHTFRPPCLYCQRRWPGSSWPLRHSRGHPKTPILSHQRACLLRCGSEWAPHHTCHRRLPLTSRRRRVRRSRPSLRYAPPSRPQPSRFLNSPLLSRRHCGRSHGRTFEWAAGPPPLAQLFCVPLRCPHRKEEQDATRGVAVNSPSRQPPH